MPIFFQQELDDNTRLAIWKIAEEESFFDVPLQRSITHPHKRLQHLAGRYLLRYLFPDFPLSLILIADTRKPFLEDEAYHFSISHCGDFAAVIVSRTKRVGIDIEIPVEKVMRITHKFLHTQERAYLATKPTTSTEAAQQQLWTTVLWSAKEAVFKWWGHGEVDFSEMIRLDTRPRGAEGRLPGSFQKGAALPVEVTYKIFPELCLAWVL